MRFNEYKLLNELCESITEAIDYMINNNNNLLMADCLMAMEMIEKVLSNDADCRVAYNAFTKLKAEMKAIGVDDDCIILKDLMSVLFDKCTNSVKYKIHVLFVAELGSKWDSMSSVYNAFKARDDVEVDVVLEPIFRAVKLPDGTTRSDIIYKDFLSPMGIKNISYLQYDISKACPDITFISQPYESVTIPMFWPENIAKYSKLVYLPYFMATSLKYGSTMESFISMPVENCAWKIACQSEKMKEYYAKYGSMHGNNVIVTGLPKWDFAIQSTREFYPCPKEWTKKLAGKKVLLLNTHFSNIFKSPDELNKSNLFAYVNGSEDLALIWRPHPMTESVLKVYRPENYKKYLLLKEFVEQSSNMVIDTNYFYSMAFAWSDMLIDCQSSIISQYALLEKPIVLCSCNNSQENNFGIFNIEDEGLFDYKAFSITYGQDQRNYKIDKCQLNNCEYKKKLEELKNKYYYHADGNTGTRFAEIIIREFYLDELGLSV